MNAAQLTYASAEDVAEYLNSTNADQIDVGVLTAALINALTRIDQLEESIEFLKRVIDRPSRVRARESL